MITPRQRVLGRIADHLVARRGPLRVAVDGITASGKTTLARELTAAVASRGRSAAHLSMDGFHNPRGELGGELRHLLQAERERVDAHDVRRADAEEAQAVQDSGPQVGKLVDRRLEDGAVAVADEAG